MGEQVSIPSWAALTALGVLLLLLLLLLMAWGNSRSQLRRELRSAHRQIEELGEQLTDLESRVADQPGPRANRAPSPEFVITRLGDADPATPTSPVPTVEARLFADIVLRETVVQAAALAHGVRRALRPEVRNRVRFEMRRETKRARKQRRVDTREAVRDWQARQRGATP